MFIYMTPGIPDNYKTALDLINVFSFTCKKSNYSSNQGSGFVTSDKHCSGLFEGNG